MLTSLLTGLVLQTGALSAALPDARFTPPSWPVEQTMIAHLLRFSEAWGRAWLNTALADARSGAIIGSKARGALFHCHRPAPVRPGAPVREPMGENADVLSPGMARRQVASAYHSHLFCPYWVVSAPTPPRDERFEVDQALAPAWREPIRATRDSLLDLLDSAATAAPESRLISGLRLRLALDQADRTSATAAVQACAADAWWCTLLRGHERHRAGDAAAARAAFREAAALNTDPCAVFDVAMLPGDADRLEGADRRCEARAGLRDTLWWLSRPFLDDTTRQRELEHYSRGVDVMLRSLLPRTERLWMLDSAGGDAVREILRRYGAPQLMTLVGFGDVERQHSDYLIDRGLSGPLTEPYPTLEYQRGAVSLVPTMRAIRSPFTAAPTEWQVSPPRDEFDQDETDWFPQELWTPPRPLIQLDRGQTVLLRREGGIHLASALHFGQTALQRGFGTTVRGIRLFTSRGPTQLTRVTTLNGVVGRPLVVRADVPAERAVVGVEFDPREPGMLPLGRARWGMTPPPTLDALRPGEYAISPPVLIAPPRGNEFLSPDPDAALARLLPQTTFSPSERVGVYWETYGLQAGDSVDLAIWIERVTPQGVLRNLGIAVRVATDLNTPVAVSWSEPQPSRSAMRIGGVVPIMSRVITLDLSTLIEGDYRLEVAVGRPGQTPVRGRTNIAIRR